MVLAATETIFGGGPPAALRGLQRAGRRSARKLAEAIMPASMIVWRGPETKASPSGSRVALTFDDGPDSMTPEYLSILADLGVRATFFLIGELCEKRPDLVSWIADAGHEVGAHGYTHRRFPSLTTRELEHELWRTQVLLPRMPGSRPLVRPPHGAMSVASMLTSARAGFTTVMWSHDSCDARTEERDEVAAAFSPGSVKRGDIVLMHEGQRWTLDALPKVVKQLREAGHALVTVGELLHG